MFIAGPVNALRSLIADRERRIRDLIEALLLEYDPLKFAHLRAELDGVNHLFDEWSQEEIRRNFRKSDYRALKLLGATSAWSATQEQTIQNIRSAAHTSFVHATSHIGQMPSRLRNRELSSLLDPIARIAVRRGQDEEVALSQQLARTMVHILGRNGRQYTFGLERYSAMVAQNAYMSAESLASIVRVRELGRDLVRCSPNDSAKGDFCDAYKGKVFSITGAMTGYAMLADLPNGGAPFHPWCQHFMVPFTEEEYTAAELEDLADVDDDMLGKPSSALDKTWGRTR